ncbi:MAG: hypothetical protein GAK35_02967 [Herbaspirillum frisingense]|uniref:DUF2076 domain-containing protein n=1 Tax=Herbaspirillum frisingense TaxID=92645 RepID=A0A7V8FV33_9BURK|nr:MAG: hypothetical protein GAK35_02967 [Herbaspirillum frisingense]
MSPQETQTLQDFLNQLTQVRGIAKDAQADAMIAAAVAQQPDAAYLLVQRALLMEQALTASKAQIASLQNQVQSLQSNAAPSPGFLDGNAWGHAPGAPVRSSPVPAYTPPPAPVQAAPQYQAAPAPTPSSGFFGGGMGSMLGTVAATAAGVAGGAFLFQGIEHLMNGGGSGLAHQNGLSAPVENVENTTVNNYYGSDADKNTAQAGNDSGNEFSDLANIDLDDSGYDDSIA